MNWLRLNPGVETAYRLAEGGVHDEGDVRFIDMDDGEWTVECKAREVLNVTRELTKSRNKAPDRARTILAWKRLTKKGTNTRRTPDGEAVVFVIGADTLALLLKGTE